MPFPTAGCQRESSALCIPEPRVELLLDRPEPPLAPGELLSDLRVVTAGGELHGAEELLLPLLQALLALLGPPHRLGHRHRAALVGHEGLHRAVADLQHLLLHLPTDAHIASLRRFSHRRTGFPGSRRPVRRWPCTSGAR